MTSCRSVYQIVARERSLQNLGDRWWLQVGKREEGMIGERFSCNLRTKRGERPNVGGVCIRSGNGGQSQKACAVNGQMTESKQQGVLAPPSPVVEGTDLVGT